MLRMDQVYVIRHKYYTERLSIRLIARDLQVSRNTVRKYLFGQDEPKRAESGPRRRRIMENVAPRIEAILQEWSGRTTAKQRITGARIHQQLVEESYSVGITVVREYLAEKRRRAKEVFIPLLWDPGQAAQVDFFEVTVDVEGERQKAWKFVMHLMFSGKDFVWLYARCNQIAFLDGHVRGFAHFGGVCARLIYDRLTAAVKRRVGISVELTDRFLALASHYLFEPCFARPGEGHDKGGVEARGKGIRLQHLTPIPCGKSLVEIAQKVLHDIDARDPQRRDEQGRSVAERFTQEKALLSRLPDRPFEARCAEPVLLDRQSVARVEGGKYTLPSGWVSLTAMAHVGVADIRFECRGETVVVQKVPRGGKNVQYRHYLKDLAVKPQAVRQVASRLLPELGEPYGKLWELMSLRYGEREAARVVAKLLGAIVKSGEEPVREALKAVLEHHESDPGSSTVPAEVEVPASLSGYHIESVAAGVYDALLTEAVNE